MTIVVRGKDETKKAFSSVKKGLNAIGNIAQNALGMALGIGLTQIPGMIAGIGKSMVNLVEDAANVQQVSKTFDKLTESIGESSDAVMGDLRDATRGMVNDAELMQAANKFMAMGLAENSEETAKMAEMATQLGMAMGEDATSSMENFALMLANQSIPRLDSFGISSGVVRERINELMESTEGLTREQAFMQAVMEEAEKTMATVGEQGGGTKASMDRLKATFDNIKSTLGQALLPALGQVLDVFSGMVTKYGPQLQAVIEDAGEAFGVWVSEVLPLVVHWFKDELIPWIEDKFISAAKLIIAWIRDEAVPWILDRLIPALELFVAWIREDAIPWIETRLIPAIKLFIEWIKYIYETFVETYDQLSTTIDQLGYLFDHLWEYIQLRWDQFVATLREWPDKLRQAGADLVEGLKQGIANAWDSLANWLRGKIEDLIGGVLAALGIGSPSKVFAEIGENMMRGLKLGLEAAGDLPAATLDYQMGRLVGNRPSLAVAGGGASFGQVAGAGVGATGTFVIHNHFGAGSVRSDADIEEITRLQEQSLIRQGVRSFGV